MDTSQIDRLHAALIVNRDDPAAYAELRALMLSRVAEERWAAMDTLRDFGLLPGLVETRHSKGYGK